MNIHLKYFLLISLLSSTSVVAADTGKQRLLKFFAEVKSLQADFSQQVQSKGFSSAPQSSGLLRMQRPGKFRWDYKTPFEQQLIADGTNLWIFDIDLDQIQVQPLDVVLGNTPAGLLSGDANVSERFDIREISAPSPEDNPALNWIELKPKGEEDSASFQILLMAFGKDLEQLVLTDSFGQKTRITLKNLVRNPTIDPAVFNFVPPAGVDVIGEKK